MDNQALICMTVVSWSKGMIKEDNEVKPVPDKCELPKSDEKLSLSNDLKKEYDDVQNDLPTNNIKEKPSLTKCNNFQKQFNNDTVSVKIEKDFNQINEEIFVGPILKSNKKQLFKCTVCNEEFLLRFFLNNHMKKTHDKENTCECNKLSNE